VTGGFTYDSGALIAAERDQRRMWLLHERALTRGVRPVVPAGVLTEAYRSGRQVNLARLLSGCRVEALDEDRARRAGALLGLCLIGRGSISPGAVDASVAEGALRRGDTVVTGNAEPIRALADGAGRKLAVITV
jgi:predicted nucleic acid-binding protein